MKTMMRIPLAGLLLAFLVFALPMAAATANHSDSSLSLGAKILLVLVSAGVVAGTAGVVTYRCPASVAGTVTAPTTAQVTNYVCADVAMADDSTATTVTHNLSGVSNTGANGSPMYNVSLLVAGATPVGMGVTVAFTVHGLILTALSSAAGNGQTYRVQMWRHSYVSNFQN